MERVGIGQSSLIGSDAAAFARNREIYTLHGYEFVCGLFGGIVIALPFIAPAYIYQATTTVYTPKTPFQYAFRIQCIMPPPLQVNSVFRHMYSSSISCGGKSKQEMLDHYLSPLLLALPDSRFVARSPLMQCLTIHGCDSTSSSGIRFSGSRIRSWVVSV